MNTMLLDHPHPRVLEIDDDLPRRRLLSGIGALGLSVTLAGCAEDEETAGASAPAPAPSPTGPFPIRIDHKFGTTEIPAEPKRVVTIGTTEQDTVLALGVRPVGVTEWFGEMPFATWPWARGELGDAEPQVLQLELNVEAVAALRPDLIIGTDSAITAEQYDLLTQVAPTLAQDGAYDDYKMPWFEQTVMIGRALGRTAVAESQVAETQNSFEAARAELAEYAGSSAVLARAPFEGNIDVFAASSRTGQMLNAFGLVVPDEIEQMAGDNDRATVSLERLDLIDRDLLVWTLDADGGLGAVEDLGTYRSLRVVEEGREVFISEMLRAAVSFNTVLSLRYAVELLVPLLAAALDGDPATTAELAVDPSPASTPNATPTS